MLLVYQHRGSMRKIDIADVECLWAELMEKKEHFSAELLFSFREVFTLAAKHVTISSLLPKEKKEKSKLYLVK